MPFKPLTHRKPILLRYQLPLIFIILSGIIIRLVYIRNQLALLSWDNARRVFFVQEWVQPRIFSWWYVVEFFHGIEVSIEAILAKIFGWATFHYDFLGLIKFVILSIFYYLCVKKISGKTVALLASFFLAFAPPVFILHSLFFPVYANGVMFLWVILFLFLLIREAPTFKRYLSLSLVSGLAIATTSFVSLIAVIAGWTTLFLKDRKSFFRKYLLIYLLVLILAFLAVFNFHQLYNDWHYGLPDKGRLFRLDPHFFKNIFYIAKACLFVPGTNRTYLMSIGFQNKLPKIIYGFYFLIAILLWLYFRRREFKKVVFFPAYLLLFTVGFAATLVNKATTRYYLAVIPILLYFLAEVLVRTIAAGRKNIKIAGWVLLILFIGFSVSNNLHFYPSPYQDVLKVIKFAKDNHIEAIYTGYPTQFALMLYSRGEIAASSKVNYIYSGWDYYDDIVEKAPKVAYLFEDFRRSELEKCLTQTKTSCDRKKFGRLALYYNLSPRLAPSAFERLRGRP